jgi:FkbM family methyltransferase
MIKRSALVNTRAGVWAQRLRDGGELVMAALRQPERAGTVANDALARTLLERLCLPGRVFVDVGAHIGSVIDGARRHSRPAALIAVEAIPDKADALRAKFPDVTIHCCAVGEADGEMPFFVDLRRPGYSSLYRTKGAGGDIKEIRVPIRRLDDLVGEAAIDIVKIDVEGAELGVLRGSEALVARSRPTVMFESGPEEAGGYTKAALWDWFEAHDYALLVPNRVAHEDPGLSRDGFLEAHLYPRRTTNYFAVARERRDEVRARARTILGL